MKGPLDSSGHARSESIVPLLPYAEHSRPSTPLSSKFSHRQSAPDVQRRRVFFLAGAILSVVSVMALATLTIGRTTGGSGYVVSELEEGHSQASNATITPSVSVAAPSPPASTSAVPEVSHEITLDGLSDYVVCSIFPLANYKNVMTLLMNAV